MTIGMSPEIKRYTGPGYKDFRPTFDAGQIVEPTEIAPPQQSFWEKMQSKIKGIDMGDVAGLGALGVGGTSLFKFLQSPDVGAERQAATRGIAGQKAQAMHDIGRRISGAKQGAYGNLAARGLSTAGGTFDVLAGLDVQGAQIAGGVASQYDAQLAETLRYYTQLEQEQAFKWADVGDLAMTAATLLL